MHVSILARLARFAVRSCLKPALQPTFPVSVQRRWANITTRTLSVPFGVNFSQFLQSLGAPGGIQNSAPSGVLPAGWPQW